MMMDLTAVINGIIRFLKEAVEAVLKFFGVG